MQLVAIASLVTIVAATADPQITPRAELLARQNSDAALLGWVSASQFSDKRSCDFPATLSRSGSLAQCCSGTSCVFWSSCSAGTLFASQTSLFCDQGYCNTAVLVPTVGASSGQSFLGCWATSLGQSAFTIVQDIGSASVVVPSSTGRPSGNSGASSPRSTPAASSTVASSQASGSTTQSATGAAQSTGAVAVATVQPLAGVFGLVAMLFRML